MDVLYKGFSIKVDPDEDQENPFVSWDTGFEIICGGEFTHLSSISTPPTEYRKKWTVYGYSHSGLSCALTPYNDRFDSGILGELFCVADDIPDMDIAVESILSNFNNWLSGEVYGYRIFFEKEEIDSCWGFFGDEDYCLSQAIEYIDGLPDNFISLKKNEHLISQLEDICDSIMKAPLPYELKENITLQIQKAMDYIHEN